MYIRTIKLEKAALKAYRNDPLTDDEESGEDQQSGSYFNGSWWNPFGKGSSTDGSMRSVDEENGHFEGGSRSNRDDSNS